MVSVFQLSVLLLGCAWSIYAAPSAPGAPSAPSAPGLPTPTPPGPSPSPPPGDTTVKCSVTVHNFIPTDKSADVRCAYDPANLDSPDLEAEQIGFKGGASFDTSEFKANKPPACQIVQHGSPDAGKGAPFFAHDINWDLLSLGDLTEDTKCYVALVLVPGEGCLNTCKQLSVEECANAQVQAAGCRVVDNACALECDKRTEADCEMDNLCWFSTGKCAAVPDKEGDIPLGGNHLWNKSTLQQYRVDLPAGAEKDDIYLRAAQLIPDLACSQDPTSNNYGRLALDVRVKLTGEFGPGPTTPSAEAPSAAPAPSAEAKVGIQSMLDSLGATDLIVDHFGQNGMDTIGVSPEAHIVQDGDITVALESCNPEKAPGCPPENYTSPPELPPSTISASDLDKGTAAMVVGFGALDGLGADFKSGVGATTDGQPSTSAFQEPWPYIIIGIGVIVVLAIVGYFVYKRQQPKDEEAKPLLG